MEEVVIEKKQGFWHLVAETDLFEMVEKSGFGEYEFILFQKRRLKASLLSMLASVVPTILLNPWFATTAVLFFVYTWRSYYTKEKNEYQGVLYEKQISWYIFQRLVVTYLKGSGGSLFNVFNKILDRLEEGEFKDNLYRITIDITNDSQSAEPFIKFAEQAAGGTDSSLTFMTSLYNFKNHTNDSSVIDELSDTARREMMRGVHDIRTIKEKSFYFFPTKLTMLNVIPMFGYMVGVAYGVFMRSSL